MRVSIIIPMYGVAPYIERCSRSLFEQVYGDCEFIFIDDCSKDDSAAIVERVSGDYPHLAERVKILRNDSNIGVSATRNRGIELATGEYILFVDGDDWCHAELVEQLAYEAMLNKAEIIACDYKRSAKEGDRVVRTPFIGGRVGSLKIVITQSFAIANRVWGMLISRELLHSHNLRFDSTLLFGEDYLLLVKMLYYAKSIGYVSQPLYFYRADSSTSISNNISPIAKRSYIRAVRLVCQFLEFQADARSYRSAMRHARYNLRRWLLHKSATEPHEKIFSIPYRLYRLLENSIYRLWCNISGRWG